MSSRKKTDAAGAGKVPLPSFELTAEETALAARYFSAMRRVEPATAYEANSMFCRAAENLADSHPRHIPPRLRLVTGGAR